MAGKALLFHTNCTLNNCGMQRNSEVGLFTEPSGLYVYLK
jgi:hypothetical protein